MSASTDTKSLEFVESAGVALAAAEKMALDVNTEKQAAVKLAGPFPKFPSDLGLPRLKLNVPIKFVLTGKAG